MVIDVIINFIYSVLTTILSPILNLPDVALPADMVNAFINMRSFLDATDFVIPYATLMAIIASMIAIEAGIMAYKVIYWLIKRIPTQS
jgi:hypothetical protein